MKKIISMIISLALCALTITAFAEGDRVPSGGSGGSSVSVGTGVYTPSAENKNAGGYIDVDSSASYANAVGRLHDFGVMRGYEDGTFRPDRVVTRAEAAALICAAKNIHAEDIVFVRDIFPEEAHHSAIGNYGEPLFSDVQENHWAYKFISYAAEMYPAPVRGYEDGTFHPDSTVTYQEFIKMCVCLIGYGDMAEENGGYPHGYMMQAAQLGLTNGIRTVESDAGITRADAAVILENTLEAPILTVDGLEIDENGRVTEKSKMMDGTGADYKNLLMMYFNIYKVTASAVNPYATPMPAEIDYKTYETAVKDLIELKILDKDFDPDANVTKGDFAKYTRRMLYAGDEKIESRYNFTDAADDRKDIYLMTKLKYIDPVSDTKFGTNDVLTRLELYDTMARLHSGVILITQDLIRDEVRRIGVTEGIDNIDRLNFSDPITGRELAVALHNKLDIPRGSASGSHDEFKESTLRDMLSGKGGFSRIDEKGKKVLDFKDVTLPVTRSHEEMYKLGTVSINGMQQIIVSLDDAPAYCDYYLAFRNIATGIVFVYSSPYTAGDLDAKAGSGGEFEIYISAAPVSATVSGSVYVKDSDD